MKSPTFFRRPEGENMRRTRPLAAGIDMMLCVALLTSLLGSATHLSAQPNPYNQTFTAFESGQVRPLAITPDRKYLLAVNTPDAKLEIFDIKNDGLEHRVSVPVGLEPVAVAIRSNDEAWVVNHLSDSVSIVALNDKNSHVRRTLLVGDEPRDIVFAGQNRNRAFITTAHRGQNSPINPQLTTPSVGRADVWVFDANLASSSSSHGAEPLTILTFFADTPRALAVTPDGNRVYAASFFSGNRTASTFAGSAMSLQNPLPPFKLFDFFPFPLNVNAFGQPQPITSAIVKYDGTNWKDETGLNRDAEMMFTLPDRDVFAIDAARQSAAGSARSGRCLFAGRNDALQHDRQPGERKSLRIESGVEQHAAVRGSEPLCGRTHQARLRQCAAKSRSAALPCSTLREMSGRAI